MSEETDAPQGGAEVEAVAETSQVEQNSEDTAEQQTEAEETGQADETSDTPKRKPWWEKRFDELTAQKYDAAREAAYWRGIAEGRQPQQEQAQEQAIPDRWEDPEGYDQYLIDKAKREFRAESQQHQRLSTYEERVSKFASSNPDYNEVVTHNRGLPITPNMANVIFESDLGPQVAYHLGKNPQEAARIAALPEYRQAAELGRLEASLSAPPAQPQINRTPPPAPPKTVAGLSAGINKAPEDMTMAEYITARNAGTI